MLSEVLGSIARLCKSLQTEGFDLVQDSLAVASTLQELHPLILYVKAVVEKKKVYRKLSRDPILTVFAVDWQTTRIKSAK